MTNLKFTVLYNTLNIKIVILKKSHVTYIYIIFTLWFICVKMYFFCERLMS